jgi:hypothetical protein
LGDVAVMLEAAESDSMAGVAWSVLAYAAAAVLALVIVAGLGVAVVVGWRRRR